MSELKAFDETIDDKDEYETPQYVFDDLIKKYKIKPILDPFADSNNAKCDFFFDKEANAFTFKWAWDLWINPPHSKTEEAVLKANDSWLDHNINIIMIVPANAIGAHYFDKIFDCGAAKYYRYSGRIRFLQHGKPAPASSRNGYFVVIWRKR